MSYSFRITAPNKALALAAIALEFDKVAAAQACHARYKAQAMTAAGAFVALLDDDDTQDVAVSMSGYLSGQWQGSDVTSISGASVSISAGLLARMAQG